MSKDEKIPKIYYTDMRDAPAEDIWDNIEEITIDDVRKYMKEQNIDIDDVIKNSTEQFAFRFAQIDLEERNDEYGGTASPAILIPMSRLNEIKEEKI